VNAAGGRTDLVFQEPLLDVAHQAEAAVKAMTTLYAPQPAHPDNSLDPSRITGRKTASCNIEGGAAARRNQNCRTSLSKFTM
jgi:hypothetical protein